MREYRENEIRAVDEPEKIDITSFLTDIFQGIKKFWWLVISLAIICGATSYLKVTTSYSPTYVASATLAVKFSGSNSSYVNMESAQQIA